LGLELKCRLCHTYSDEEDIFCRGCGVRLLVSRKYDLTKADYAYEGDLEKLALLKELATPVALLKTFYLKKAISLHEKEVSSRSTVVDRDCGLGSLLVRCAGKLCLKYLPKMYVDSELGYNAYSFGFDEKPYVVIGEALLDALNEQEVVALLGHELGHIGCGHMLYHTLAEFVLQGVSFSATALGIPLLEAPLRLALLSWRRESEVSADRASLLVTDSVDAVKSLLRKVVALNDRASLAYDALTELVSSHPHISRRIALLEEYYRSAEYGKAKCKIEKRSVVHKALLPICRFCGAKKPPSSLFCPRCGRSLV
jgi:hypothetical protein